MYVYAYTTGPLAARAYDGVAAAAAARIALDFARGARHACLLHVRRVVGLFLCLGVSVECVLLR